MDFNAFLKELGNSEQVGYRANWSTKNPISDIGSKSIADSLYLLVEFENYTGDGIRQGSGIASIRKGSILFTFNVDSSSASDVTLGSFSAKTVIPFECVAINGSSVAIYTTEMSLSGTSQISFSYTEADSASGSLAVSGYSSLEAEYTVTDSEIIETDNSPDLAWNEMADTSWFDEGESSFSISTANELAGVAKLVNDGVTEFEGKTITLSADIDLENLEWDPIGGPYQGPDGTGHYNADDDSYKGFRGIFDGQNHEIRNLSIIKTITNTKDSFAYVSSDLALFGVLEEGASVKDLTIRNVHIEGDAYIGAVFGVVPASHKASVENPVTLEDINVTGDIYLKGKFCVGGIAGRVDSSKTKIHMTNCSVNPSGNRGFIGFATEEAPLYYSNNYIGGMIGASYSSVESIYTGCSVSGVDITCDLVGAGGFAGIASVNTTFDSCSVSSVSITMEERIEGTEYGDARPGAFVGASTDDGTFTFAGTNSATDVRIVYPFAETDNVTTQYRGIIGTNLSGSVDFSITATGIDSVTSDITFVYTDTTL